MSPENFKYIATAIFALAVLHTFVSSYFNKLASKYPEGSPLENLFHFLGEIEAVFGLWLIPLFYAYWASFGLTETLDYFDSVTPKLMEPLFVIVIMVMAATRPILKATQNLVAMASKLVPIPSATARYYATVLAITPLLGSFITEPAAMTISALLLSKFLYENKPSPQLMYTTIALLFVNVSIGGTLTHFAAPPVLMVANKWHWDINFTYMATHFGWKAAVSIFVCTSVVTTMFFREFKRLDGMPKQVEDMRPIPFWVTGMHVIALAWSVVMAHHPLLLILGFMFFFGWCIITNEYQSELQLKPALLVGFFLAGLVTHGSLQDWWISPIIAQLESVPLFIGSTILTAFNDNAAITYLSTLALDQGFSGPFTEMGLKKYAIVAGAVTGGGLTIIANAPNPAGNAILSKYFPGGSVNPGKLFLFALPFTIIAALCFMLL